jgi:SAM-dependent methyltransferase
MRYKDWNRRWGAPFGNGILNAEQHQAVLDSGLSEVELLRQFGPFILQRNNSTRAYEYPWAYEQVAKRSCRTIVEIGGGLSGLQFVFGIEGRDVTNVDPGDFRFPLHRPSFCAANRVLGIAVRLRQTEFVAARLPDQCADAVVSISTLEHLDVNTVRSLLADVLRVLRPEGRLILTVDLFLNLEPFSQRKQNRYGTNLPLWEVLMSAGYSIEYGSPAEILSGPSFQPKSILGRLNEFMIGQTYPALTQLVVASGAAHCAAESDRR